jgi:hypothetical protein
MLQIYRGIIRVAIQGRCTQLRFSSSKGKPRPSDRKSAKIEDSNLDLTFDENETINLNQIKEKAVIEEGFFDELRRNDAPYFVDADIEEMDNEIFTSDEDDRPAMPAKDSSVTKKTAKD